MVNVEIVADTGFMVMFEFSCLCMACLKVGACNKSVLQEDEISKNERIHIFWYLYNGQAVWDLILRSEQGKVYGPAIGLLEDSCLDHGGFEDSTIVGVIVSTLVGFSYGGI